MGLMVVSTLGHCVWKVGMSGTQGHKVWGWEVRYMGSSDWGCQVELGVCEEVRHRGHEFLGAELK